MFLVYLIPKVVKQCLYHVTLLFHRDDMKRKAARQREGRPALVSSLALNPKFTMDVPSDKSLHVFKLPLPKLL